ncbi:Actin-related protein 2/3 complex subunit 3 AltName: Full=Arp2/3 complex 21 kDa subunit; Short=p21-ARC [Cyberlindnera jadinii]|uniref:Actin-related protein 2/3 complex subunit 3 n=1 Tax=Cyberlindnera jadinii (strain ATCC 18201 / CBS 1600 / BCRC 20928 / JCM 3617 / NBRC 0987 / NRRL Y-1542) TaxID=983966 RepID=A0A0H5C2L9_CYBJN|nr:actin-related protein 2/3 complex subunit 3 [Cyberlindnera jadinii NRRL Y-1542]ODV72419.1 actin-related protein 2/3 complex subunit 3 [Cyberlindnera jadinii NRRL Y-1542]CEP22036.1 Actin-related protein 2/3 complex subunit 3 AltName: Full=Arp2/3 complex 21 kDa subunit; Short=p21-ARC [Cyberlindnera jadinii]
MPAYHSTFLSDPASNERLVGNFSLLPLKTKFRGPAYPSDSDYDIIDEVLDLFRANSFFKNFEIKGPADRVLIYGILFVSDCLSKISPSTSASEATKILTNLSLENFAIPGDGNFPLNSLYQPPRDRSEHDLLKGYLTQFRQELSARLIQRIYVESQSTPSKYWLAFTRRRFMNKSL